MRCLALVLSLGSAFLCLARASSNVPCSMAMTRSLCALPANFSIKSVSDTACLIQAKLAYDADRTFIRRLRFYEEVVAGEHNSSISSCVEYDRPKAVDRSDELVKISLSAECFLTAFNLALPNRVSLRFVGYIEAEGEKYECPFKEIEFVYDKAPTVHFELLNDTSFDTENTRNANGSHWNFDGASDTKVTLRMSSMNSSIVLIVHVFDEDVFKDNEDPFEFSTAGKPQVNISAVVHLSYQSRFNLSAYFDEVSSAELEPEANSVNCEFAANWCRKDLSDSSLNNAHVQYRFLMAELMEAVNPLFLDPLKPYDFAQVDLSIRASAASGRSSLKGEGALTLSLIIPVDVLQQTIAVANNQVNEAACNESKNVDDTGIQSSSACSGRRGLVFSAMSRKH